MKLTSFSFLEHSAAWTTTAKTAIEWTAMEVWTATRTFRSTLAGILASEEIQAVNHVQHRIAVDGIILRIRADVAEMAREKVLCWRRIS